MKRIVLIVMMGLFSFLFGCRNHVEPIPFPEDATLTGLYLSVQGEMMRPYYILYVENGTAYMKITDLNPAEESSSYFAFADTVREDETAHLVQLTDQAPIREIESWINEFHVLNWDGFHEHKTYRNRLDGDMICDLYLELSDGTTVTVYGYNVAPNGFYDFSARVTELFEQICRGE